MKNKIALISAHASPLTPAADGQINHVAALAKALSDIGFDVDIYTRRDSLELDEIVYFYHHVRVFNVLAGPAKPIPTNELLMYMDEFADMMLDIITDYHIQYNLIHAHCWLSGHVAIKVKQALAVPLVASFDELGAPVLAAHSDENRIPAERIDVEDEIVWHADQLIATNPDQFATLLELYHADPSKVEVIPERRNLSGGALSASANALAWESIAEQTAALYERLMIPKTTSTVIKSRPMLVKNKLAEATALFQLTAETLCADVAEAAQALSESIKKGAKVLVCGHSGSGTGIQHFVSQLVGRAKDNANCRYAALSLNGDPALLAAWANGQGAQDAFARQVEALGNPGDVLVCFSADGSTEAIANALRQAQEQQMLCINFLGNNGGQLSDLGQHNLLVPSADPARVSEMHLHLIHSVCELVAQDLATFRSSDDQHELRREVAV